MRIAEALLESPGSAFPKLSKDMLMRLRAMAKKNRQIVAADTELWRVLFNSESLRTEFDAASITPKPK